ncbi:MAG: acetyl-CoA carboxylase biotin carboxyl carrier protein [Bradyrhizobium sp.]
MSLSYEDVAEILKIIDSSSCDEVIVETGDIKLVVRRNTAPGHAGPAAERAGVAPAIAARPRPNATTARQATTGQTAAAGQIEVTAPMVGTFYRAPSPDAPPFVEIGTLVQPGQPLCIIEVMKLFTTINSECAGRVVQIGAETGDLVEYGRTLFIIEPAEG